VGADLDGSVVVDAEVTGPGGDDRAGDEIAAGAVELDKELVAAVEVRGWPVERPPAVVAASGSSSTASRNPRT